MHNYHDVAGCLPIFKTWGGPNGNDCRRGSDTWHNVGGFSWRVMILPYIDQETAYNQIDFNDNHVQEICNVSPPSWDTVNRMVIPVYVCPSDPTGPFPGGGARGGTGTNYGAVIYATDNANNPSTFAEKAVFQQSNSGSFAMKLVAISDGTSNTIAVAEVYRDRYGE